MIEGQVTSEREIVFFLRLRGAADVEIEVEAVLDTGLTDYLTLPADIVESLRLPRIESTPMTLADRSRVVMPVHEVRVLWQDRLRRIPVHMAAGSPLIGMSLLYGSYITLEAVDGGAATIEDLE